LPSATAIAPGTGIAVTYADGTGGMSCTAGFLVRTNTGQTGVLTAGHCNKPGEASRVSINDGSGTYVDIGTFGQDVSEGNRGEAHDIGLIMLDSDKVPRTSAITATVPVVGIATDLRLGQVLCKFGMKTGKALCGQITEITESKVAFLAGGECGDSGGPVYLVQSDGTAVAVGIHIRGGRPNDPNPNCSVPATFSVAELLQPWLDKWGLTAVTETGSH
jgi:V8-like Glu-specific endopeptidase